MKKEGKISLEQLKCNVVMVKQSTSSKILRLNLKGSAANGQDNPKLGSALTNTGNRSVINDHAGVIKECDYRSNQLGSLKRAAAVSSRRDARLNSASKRRANHTFNSNAKNIINFYEGAASSESSDVEDVEDTAACAHLFTSESETGTPPCSYFVSCV